MLKVRGPMSHPFQHPSAKVILKRVAQLFRSDKAYILKDSNIVFVCGGPIDDRTVRSLFLKYAASEITNLRMFLAEDAEKDYVTHDDPEFHNVAEFEELIGDVSDCVILFPESPGSFAELGHFSQSPHLRKKLLIAHDAALQSQDSFILRGPVALIDNHSIFKPTIQILYSAPDFILIKQRLEKRLTGKKRKLFNYTTYSLLTFREKFFALLEIVKIFSAISLDGIEYVFKSIFEHSSIGDIKHQLSILIAARLVVRAGENLQYFCLNPGSRTFMEFDGFEVNRIRLELLDFYIEEAPAIPVLVKGLTRVD